MAKVKPWEPGTDYERGDLVKYHGRRFKAIQKHSSQGDWTPGVTPALWGMLEEDDDDDNQPVNENQGYRPQVPVYQRPNYQNDEDEKTDQYQATPQYQTTPQHQEAPPPPPPQYQNNQGSVQQDKPPNRTEEEKKAHWYDLTDERKKQFEIGGAIAAGLGLAGAGYGIWKHHEKSEEEKKAHAWALDNWVKDAQTRTDEYHNGVRRGPATWILTHEKNFPRDAIVVEEGRGETLYICRAYYDGGKQIGKASQAFQKGAVIGYKHDEIELDTFEILVGDMRGLRWVPFSGRLNVGALGYKHVEGGNENDGTPLYIVKAPYKGSVYPGKTSEKLEGAYIPYKGTEKNVKEYSVLCYN